MDLYISDLDGTLLNSSGQLSDYTVNRINTLIAQGLNFTIATARGIDSVKELLKPLNLELPIILNNGLFIYDLKKDKIIKSHCINNTVALEIYEILLAYKIQPMVRVLQNKRFKVYYHQQFNKASQEFIASKRDAQTIDFIKEESIEFNDFKCFSIFTIDKKEVLQDASKFLKSKFSLGIDFYHDIYNNSYWLEINPLKASKGEAALLLKEKYNFEGIISFGDNLNDLSMFQISDFSHGMCSGNEKIKSHVSKVIGTNDEDSVVKEISEMFLQKNHFYEQIS